MGTGPLVAEISMPESDARQMSRMKSAQFLFLFRAAFSRGFSGLAHVQTDRHTGRQIEMKIHSENGRQALNVADHSTQLKQILDSEPSLAFCEPTLPVAIREA